jgi:hypothetical protein
VPVASLGTPWTCADNFWDNDRATCDAEVPMIFDVTNGALDLPHTSLPRGLGSFLPAQEEQEGEGEVDASALRWALPGGPADAVAAASDGAGAGSGAWVAGAGEWEGGDGGADADPFDAFIDT